MALLAAGTVGLGVRHRVATAEALILANSRPLASASTSPRTALIKAPLADPRHELPVPVEPQVADSAPPPRFDFDGSSPEQGRPMPDPREARDTKATY